MTRNVAGQQVPGENNRRTDDILQPRAADQTPALGEGRETDPQKAGERGQADEGENNTARIFEVSSCQATQRDDDKLDRARGELQQRGVDAAESEAADQGGCEVRYAAVDDAAAESDEHEAVDFEIEECF